MRARWAHDDPRWRKHEWWFAAVFLALFAHAVLAWQGIHFGDDPPYRPLQMVLMTAGLAMQPLAVLARPRSVARYWVLNLASVAALVLSFTVD